MIALARRYRPKRFADLLVQDHVAAVLQGAVARGRVGHGYLLTGPRGVGKTTAARILAMALNCPNRGSSGDPCGECENCLRVWNGSANLDVVEIDAASNRGVDDARELRERAMYAASQEGRFKVYIVDEAHMLTREAWNALLKILEEPPPGVVFVFATTEPQKIAAAAAPVLSRLQRFDFRRIGPAVIRERLRQVLQAEGIAADDDALTLIARAADGGMRDALSVLDQCLSFGEGAVTAGRVREVLGLVDDEAFAELLGLVADRRPEGVFPLLDRLVNAGADLTEFMNGAGEALRGLLMLQLGAEPEGITESMRRSLELHRDRLDPGDVLRMLRLFADAEASIRRSGSVRLMVETLLLRWTMMDRIVDLEEVLGQVGQVGQRGSGTAGQPGKAEDRRGEARPARAPVAAPVSGSALAPAPAVAPATHLPAELGALREGWSEVVGQVRVANKFLSEAVAAAQPSGLEGGWLTLSLTPANAVFVKPLQAQAATVEEVLGRVTGRPLRLRVTETPPDDTAPAGGPRPLSEAALKADRLKSYRAKDPSLDTAADALDLEIVD